jgi:hypothetical protein
MINFRGTDQAESIPFVAAEPLVRERSSFIRLCDKRIQSLCKISRPFRASSRVQP